MSTAATSRGYVWVAVAVLAAMAMLFLLRSCGGDGESISAPDPDSTAVVDSVGAAAPEGLDSASDLDDEGVEGAGVESGAAGETEAESPLQTPATPGAADAAPTLDAGDIPEERVEPDVQPEEAEVADAAVPQGEGVTPPPEEVDADAAPPAEPDAEAGEAAAAGPPGDPSGAEQAVDDDRPATTDAAPDPVAGDAPPAADDAADPAADAPPAADDAADPAAADATAATVDADAGREAVAAAQADSLAARTGSEDSGPGAEVPSAYLGGDPLAEPDSVDWRAVGVETLLAHIGARYSSSEAAGPARELLSGLGEIRAEVERAAAAEAARLDSIRKSLEPEPVAADTTLAAPDSTSAQIAADLSPSDSLAAPDAIDEAGVDPDALELMDEDAAVRGVERSRALRARRERQAAEAAGDGVAQAAGDGAAEAATAEAAGDGAAQAATAEAATAEAAAAEAAGGNAAEAAAAEAAEQHTSDLRIDRSSSVRPFDLVDPDWEGWLVVLRELEDLSEAPVQLQIMQARLGSSYSVEISSGQHEERVVVYLTEGRYDSRQAAEEVARRLAGTLNGTPWLLNVVRAED